MLRNETARPISTMMAIIILLSGLFLGALALSSTVGVEQAHAASANQLRYNNWGKYYQWTKYGVPQKNQYLTYNGKLLYFNNSGKGYVKKNFLLVGSGKVWCTNSAGNLRENGIWVENSHCYAQCLYNKVNSYRKFNNKRTLWWSGNANNFSWKATGCANLAWQENGWFKSGYSRYIEKSTSNWRDKVYYRSVTCYSKSGAATPTNVYNTWRNTSANRNRMLNGSTTHMGINVRHIGSNYYYTVVFETPDANSGSLTAYRF